MKSVFVLIGMLLFVSICAQNVMINEVLYDPDGSDTGYEWIELYNPTEENINLFGWIIQKAGSEFENVLIIADNYFIPAYSYFLIGEEFVPNTDITADLAFQNGGSATDGIRLISADTLWTDTMLYDEPNSNGLPDDVSDPGEFFAPDVSSGNTLARIQDGVDSDNCELDFFECNEPTPGSPNIYPIDLAVFSLEILQFPTYYTIETYIHNLSTMDVDNSEAELGIYINNDLLELFVLPELPAQDSIFFSYEMTSLPTDYTVIRADVIYMNDNNLENNSVTNSILIGSSPIVMNELMFKPESNNQEWIEIFNRGSCGYDVDNLVIIDAIGGEIELSGQIAPQDFLVVCQEAKELQNYYPGIDPVKVVESPSWTALNNTTENLLLQDVYHTNFDSTAYDGGSCPVNFSLERVNPFEDENVVWEVSQDENGATPTMENSVLPFQKDISLEFSYLEEEAAQIQHHLLIENCGLENINSALFSCFALLNDENPQLIWKEEVTLTDSLCYQFFSDLPESGYTTFLYEINSSEDQNNENNFACSFYNNESRPFVINEIMYDPPAEEPEWLEIRINNFISDLEEIILVTNEDTLRLPNIDAPFLLVTDSEDDAQFMIDNYQLEIPVLTGIGYLSNTGEDIVLLDQSENLIETFSYSPDWNDSQDGISIERINPFIEPTADNWAASISNATPGAENSILALEYDAKLTFLHKVILEDQIEHFLSLENIGLEMITIAQINCSYTINGEEENLLYSEEVVLADSVILNIPTLLPVSGYITFNYWIDAASDLNETNDHDHSFYFADQFPFVINEIMYAPDNEPEWIEIKNNFNIPFLETLEICCNTDTFFCDYHTEEYFLITSSADDVDSLHVLYGLENIPILTGLPSLSNSGEEISLRDECGNLIETFAYLPEWNDDLSGISLERINPNLPSEKANWGPSVNKATPGTENSIFVKYLPPSAKIAINPNPFSPYQAERTIISAELPEKLSTVTLRIFDLKGRMVKKLINQNLTAARSEFIWDGKNSSGKILPIGVYILLMEATARETEKTYRKKTTVVLGK